MKKIILSLLLVCGIMISSEAQMYPTQDSKKGQTLEHWQWTAYSDYAGYYIRYWNDTEEEVTVHITANDPGTGINIDTTFVVAPYSYNVWQLGYQTPYVEGLQFDADVDGHTIHTKLSVKTYGSPYEYNVPPPSNPSGMFKKKK